MALALVCLHFAFNNANSPIVFMYFGAICCSDLKAASLRFEKFGSSRCASSLWNVGTGELLIATSTLRVSERLQTALSRTGLFTRDARQEVVHGGGYINPLREAGEDFPTDQLKRNTYSVSELTRHRTVQEINGF